MTNQQVRIGAVYRAKITKSLYVMVQVKKQLLSRTKRIEWQCVNAYDPNIFYTLTAAKLQEAKVCESS